MRLLLIAFTLLFVNQSISQMNIDSLSHISYQALHGANLNDCWGYTDEFGNEYAIVGTTKGTSIVDISNPNNPVEIFWLPGSESIWRDPSCSGDFAYITTEAEDGLTIIDLSPLPGSTTLNYTIYNGTVTDPLTSAHTCFADENSVLYVFGSNRGNGGVLMLDVGTDPMNPIELGFFDNWYAHDGFVRNDTLFCAHIADGFVSILDVSDKSNVVVLGTQITPNAFTHNVWPTDNGQYIFTTDELSGSFITVYDISDPQNMVEVERTQNSPGSGVVPHNVHVQGNFLVSSYYSDGIVIHDATYPYNLIKVGQYDTYPGQTPGYDGCWGAFPFYPSENIIASDITQGLFVLDPTFVQASYLEGTITDFNTTLALQGVSVKIIGDDQFNISNNNGFYAAGMPLSGTYSVIYFKVGYYPDTIDITLSQGVVTIQNLALVPIPPFDLTVMVTESGTGIPIDNVQINLAASLIQHTGTTNALGQEDFSLFYMEDYYVSVGKWGYITKCFHQIIDDNTLVLSIEMEKGYQDEFSFDFGWVVSGTASTGTWVREVPNGTNGNTAPGIDAEFDCSAHAYVTGNAPALHPDVDDVDGGYTMLVSPVMDLTTYTDPYLNFVTWYFCDYGNPPDDTLKVSLSNGITSAVILTRLPNLQNYSEWLEHSIRVQDFIAPTSTMQISFRLADPNPTINVTEGGVDYFYVSNNSVLETNESVHTAIEMFPNPASSSVTISGLKNGDRIEIFDLNNKRIQVLTADSNFAQIETRHFSSGMYIVKVGDKTLKLLID